MFGVSGAGTMVALWVTQLGVNSWSCRDDGERWEGLQGMTSKYLGYVYFFIKLSELPITIFDVLRKRRHANLRGQVIHNAYMVIFAYLGDKYYPKGMFCFVPLMDLMMQSTRWAYLVLASAGSALREALWWKNYISLAQITQLSILLIHSLYVMITPNCAGPLFIKLAVAVYATTSLVYYLSNIIRQPINNLKKAKKRF